MKNKNKKPKQKRSKKQNILNKNVNEIYNGLFQRSIVVEGLWLRLLKINTYNRTWGICFCSVVWEEVNLREDVFHIGQHTQIENDRNVWERIFK